MSYVFKWYCIFNILLLQKNTISFLIKYYEVLHVVDLHQHLELRLRKYNFKTLTFISRSSRVLHNYRQVTRRCFFFNCLINNGYIL